MRHDPKLDLVLERVVDVRPDLVWLAWTQPEHVKRWFTPAPWTTVQCEIDLRPGGVFYTVMRSPEGQEFPNTGCYLEIVPNRRLVWTDALQGGYRPADPNPSAGFRLTAMVLLEPQGTGTKYTAIAMHSDEEAVRKHEAMGFHEGWGRALDQLVAHAMSLT
jgi:uncharacterized protein YndB with AHSA1/START domain